MKALKRWAIFAGVHLLIVGAVLLVAMRLDSPAQAASDDVEPCEPWRKAGSVLIYRCEDWQTGDTCYAHQLGMMFCVRD